MEWIYITAHFGMCFNSPEYSLPILIGSYSIFFVLGWLFPWNRSYWQQFSYIILALTIVVFIRYIGIDIGLFLFFYIAKSYFSLGHWITIKIATTISIPWTITEYFAELDLKSVTSIPENSLSEPWNSLKFVFFSLLVYASASTFTIMFTSMVVAEQKSRQLAEELLQEVETLAATLERNRIAREIHDSLGHTLSDLDIQLEVAQKLRSHNPEQSFQAVDTAKWLAGQCIENISKALYQMRQSDFDLKTALTSLMEQLRQNSVFQVQWEVNLPQLSLYKEYQIYCIVKEGIMNVQKHARASQVSFYASLTSEHIVLDIKDNGVGFDSEKMQAGFGIQGMTERVQLLGGKIDIKTALKQGTQIQIILPL
jgi:signal transduction histidine kinase